MNRVATVRAQAKLNLWLRVLAREENGYHSIETLFHRIDLADDVTVTLAPTGERSIECSVDVGPPDENLAFRAAEQYCAAGGWETGFHIDIVKRIPAGGGLGGGSADAGATLRALNALHPEPLRDRAIHLLAARLGADVPFLAGRAPMALAWGRGDHMLELPSRPAREVVLLVPGFSVLSANAYRWLDSSRNGSPPHARALCLDDLFLWPVIPQLSDNDFMSPVIRGTAEGSVLHAVQSLRNGGAVLAGMSGSGSTLFGIFDQTVDAGALERETGFRVIVTRSATTVEAVHCSD